MPEPYRPDYEKWCSVFELFPIGEETTLVGHSCGGGFLLRWLSENKVKVGKVALVAPWLDPDHEVETDFFDFHIDPDMVSRTRGVKIFISTDDYPDILQSVATIKKELKGIEVQEFTGKKHFTMPEMKTEEVPELAQFLLS